MTEVRPRAKYVETARKIYLYVIHGLVSIIVSIPNCR